MKTKLLCIAALSVLPLFASGDGGPKRQLIESRLRETDLSLLIRQYEQVKMEDFDTSLKIELFDTDFENGGLPEASRKWRAERLAKRRDILQKRVSEIRQMILDLGGL